jgi:phosphatidylglycerol---prolipoprotein diacylglyceryl transferase
MVANIEPLNRVMIQLGPLSVYWYGFLIGSGAMLGLWLAVRESKRLGMNKEIFVDLVLYALPIAIICARLYYVLFNFEYYAANPSDILKVWQGGLAIHGGLIGAFLTGYIFCKKKGLSFWKLADIAAPSILIGQIIGRWGNFMNQEAYGGEVTREFLESLYLPDFIINQMYINGAYHHPTFLYESLWNVVGLCILLFLRRVNLRRGEIFLGYLVWYSIGRFFIEGLRTDSLMLTDTLRMAQVISLATVVVGIVFIIVRRMGSKEQVRYLDA